MPPVMTRSAHARSPSVSSSTFRSTSRTHHVLGRSAATVIRPSGPVGYRAPNSSQAAAKFQNVFAPKRGWIRSTLQARAGIPRPRLHLDAWRHHRWGPQRSPADVISIGDSLSPSTMDPQPLFGMLTHPALDDGGDHLRGRPDVDRARCVALRLNGFGQFEAEATVREPDRAHAVDRNVEVTR